jgi:pimeloyl-ACP methyl ester carboxylesterase
VPIPSKLLFLPGASGNVLFWQPVAGMLSHRGTHVHIGWPGFGATLPDPEVGGIEDLVARVLAEVDQPTALIAQSMGGVVATLAALERPDLITHLVLTVTSGGVKAADFGAQDWRPEYLAANPRLPRWFTEFEADLSARLGAIQATTLLLWGDADPISPVALGEHLAKLLPNAQLHVVTGGTHDLAHQHAARVAPLIDAHLARAA